MVYGSNEMDLGRWWRLGCFGDPVWTLGQQNEGKGEKPTWGKKRDPASFLAQMDRGRNCGVSNSIKSVWLLIWIEQRVVGKVRVHWTAFGH